MAQNIKKICITLMVWISCFTVLFAKQITVGELIENPKDFDGRKIVLEAETIGDIMKRGEKTWINVNDGSAAIGVYIETKQVEKIHMTGAYKIRGDVLKVTGIFHRAFNEQGGEMAIEGETLEIIEPGKILQNTIPIEKIKLLSIMLGITIVLVAINYWRLHFKQITKS